MVLCIWYQLLTYVLALSYASVCMLMAVCTHNAGMCPYIHANARIAGYMATLTAFLIISILFATCLLTDSFDCCNPQLTSAFDHMECGSDRATEECMSVWDRSHREMRSGDVVFPIFVIVWFVLTIVGIAYGTCSLTGRSDRVTGAIVLCIALILFITVITVCHPCTHCTAVVSRRNRGVARQTRVVPVPHMSPQPAAMVRHTPTPGHPVATPPTRIENVVLGIPSVASTPHPAKESAGTLHSPSEI